MILMTFWIGAFNCVLPSRKQMSKKGSDTVSTDFGRSYYENRERLITDKIDLCTITPVYDNNICAGDLHICAGDHHICAGDHQICDGNRHIFNCNHHICNDYHHICDGTSS